MKSDKYDFNSIINIKWLFSNNKYTINQCCKIWKKEHHHDVLEYHKKYNKEHQVWKKMAGFCDVCHKHYGNISIHKKTKKHQNNLLTK